MEESGSSEIIEICREADELALSIICLPEMTSTLCRLVREKKLQEADYRITHIELLRDLDDVSICDITPTVMSHTLRCIENNPLRAMDAIHLGCALAYEPDLFVSSDQRQVLAAKNEGLDVKDI